MNMQSEGGTSFGAILFLGEVFQIKLSKTLKDFFFSRLQLRKIERGFSMCVVLVSARI